ncbi:MAG: hypothetical protein OXE99_02855 [Cellvibrionales bacterium]|nr:hypothetical protein [Cellvibrionales bacterium]
MKKYRWLTLSFLLLSFIQVMHSYSEQNKNTDPLRTNKIIDWSIAGSFAVAVGLVSAAIISTRINKPEVATDEDKPIPQESMINELNLDSSPTIGAVFDLDNAFTGLVRDDKALTDFFTSHPGYEEQLVYALRVVPNLFQFNQSEIKQIFKEVLEGKVTPTSKPHIGRAIAYVNLCRLRYDLRGSYQQFFEDIKTDPYYEFVNLFSQLEQDMLSGGESIQETWNNLISSKLISGQLIRHSTLDKATKSQLIKQMVEEAYKTYTQKLDDNKLSIEQWMKEEHKAQKQSKAFIDKSSKVLAMCTYRLKPRIQ